MMTTEQFLARVERYLSDSGMKPTTFGRVVLGDPSFIPSLRRGRCPSLDVVNKVLAHIGEEASGAAA